MKKVYAYYDGSNFYHLCKMNYGITNVYFHHITNELIDLKNETLVKIKYFNAPVNQNEVPAKYAEQLRFFSHLRKTPFLDLILGRLVKRKIKHINILCEKCGFQKIEEVDCPLCGKKIDLDKTYKSVEKGVDVGLAINLLLDALNDKYDIALLFSGDADFCPAIRYIIKNLNKEIIFCHFPTPKTDELIQSCSENRLITKEMVEKAQINP